MLASRRRGRSYAPAWGSRWGLVRSSQSACCWELRRLVSFFAGVILYLPCCFQPQYRGRIVALFMVAIPLSSFFGLPISAALLQLNGLLGFTVGNGCSSSRRSRPSCSGGLPSSCPTGRSRRGELGAAAVAHRVVGAREIIAKSQSRPSLALGRPSRTKTSWLVRSSMRAPPARATASFRQPQIIKSFRGHSDGVVELDTVWHRVGARIMAKSGIKFVGNLGLLSHAFCQYQFGVCGSWPFSRDLGAVCGSCFAVKNWLLLSAPRTFGELGCSKSSAA